MSELSQVNRDQAKALAVRLITPTLGLRRSGDLVALARRWDRELTATSPQSELGDALARALLEIQRVLEHRLQAQFRSDPLPSVARGPIGLSERDSPTDGLIEDVSPFGNVDIWRTYLREPVKRQRRRQRRASRSPGPNRPIQRPTFRQPGPSGIGGFRNLGTEGQLLDGSIPGPLSEHISAEVATSVEFFTNLALELSGATIGPIVGGIIMFAGVVDTFEGTRRTQARAAKSWGIRLGLLALAQLIEPLPNGTPTRVSKAELQEQILGSTALGQRWHDQHVALSSVPVDQLMQESLQKVAVAYNEAIQASTAQFRERAHDSGFSPAESELQSFRHFVGRELIETAHQRLDRAP